MSQWPPAIDWHAQEGDIERACYEHELWSALSLLRDQAPHAADWDAVEKHIFGSIAPKKTYVPPPDDENEPCPF